MPITKAERCAYLIIDNSVLCLLTECFCSEHATHYPGANLVQQLQADLEHNLTTLKEFALDGQLYCTPEVMAEYIPAAGRLGAQRGVTREHIGTMVNQVKAHLVEQRVSIEDAANMRNLPAAPKKLVNPVEGLKDNDLSLVLLGLELTQHGQPVNVLSNDQDLLDFTTWIRTKTEVRTGNRAPLLLQGVRGLTFLELVHRSCLISTEKMNQILKFSMQDTFTRLAGTEKGKRIFSQLIQIQTNMVESVKIKQQSQEVVP